jgi:hypothetical protein
MSRIELRNTTRKPGDVFDMGRRKHDTSKYGVTIVRSLKMQILGGAMVVIAVLVGLLTINGLTSGI